MASQLHWSSRQSGTALVGEPSGRVDETNWEAFLTHVTAALGEAAGSGSSFVIDLAGLEYMSSRGLRVLVKAKNEAAAAKVPISLARPNGMLAEIISISKYDKIFTITETVEA